MWKWKKKGKKKEVKEVSLLEELCGDDAELYAVLRGYLYIDPLMAISKKDLNILTKEAEESGYFQPAVDKAIFEAAKNPAEKERYIKVIQNLAQNSITAMGQIKERAEKEGLTDEVDRSMRRIENLKFISERTEGVINVASKFYKERLVESKEKAGREARREARRGAEREEKRIGEMEKAVREARKEERRNMGKEERREAKEQDKIEELAAKKRREKREDARIEVEREEKRIGEMEKAAREARKEERKGD